MSHVFFCVLRARAEACGRGEEGRARTVAEVLGLGRSDHLGGADARHRGRRGERERGDSERESHLFILFARVVDAVMVPGRLQALRETFGNVVR